MGWGKGSGYFLNYTPGRKKINRFKSAKGVNKKILGLWVFALTLPEPIGPHLGL
jgi:hypothetical protein